MPMNAQPIADPTKYEEGEWDDITRCAASGVHTYTLQYTGNARMNTPFIQLQMNCFCLLLMAL